MIILAIAAALGLLLPGAAAAQLGGERVGVTVTVPPPPPQPEVPGALGETRLLPDVDGGHADRLIAQRASVTGSALVKSLVVYVESPAGQMRLGLYDATGPNGGPGGLLRDTPAFAPKAGWNAVVINPAAIPGGTYWLAMLASSGGLTQRIDRTSGESRSYAYGFGGLPARFEPANLTVEASHRSLYASFSDAAPPATPPPPPPPPVVTAKAPVVAKLCRVTITAAPPDATMGWSVQFKNGATAVGVADAASPFTRTANLPSGAYSITATWTKTGTSAVVSPPATGTCP